MVQIIDATPHKSVVKEAICKNCGVTLQYVPNEVTSETHHDYGGGSDTYHYIKCPGCGKKTEVR
jgi:Pyruvate/2-oxoacid:ferredoxin oxidoreductase delta subunit